MIPSIDARCNRSSERKTGSLPEESLYIAFNEFKKKEKKEKKEKRNRNKKRFSCKVSISQVIPIYTRDTFLGTPCILV